MSKSEFAIAEVMPGKLNAVVKNMMVQMGIKDPNEAVRRFNSGEYALTQKVSCWSVDVEGNLLFTVTSDGTSGPEWIARLESKGFRLSDWAKSLLLSKDFKPTTDISYKLIAIKCNAFENKERITKNIRSHAKKVKWQTPNAEIACLIREKFSDEEIEEMGILYLVAMDNPIKDSGGHPGLLGTGRNSVGSWLDARFGGPDGGWGDGGAFVFLLSQASSEAKP